MSPFSMNINFFHLNGCLQTITISMNNWSISNSLSSINVTTLYRRALNWLSLIVNCLLRKHSQVWWHTVRIRRSCFFYREMNLLYQVIVRSAIRSNLIEFEFNLYVHLQVLKRRRYGKAKRSAMLVCSL